MSRRCEQGCERGAPGTHWHADDVDVDAIPWIGVVFFWYLCALAGAVTGALVRWLA